MKTFKSLLLINFVVIGMISSACKSDSKTKQEDNSTCITTHQSSQYLVELNGKSWREDNGKYYFELKHTDNDLYNCGYDMEIKVQFCGSEYVASVLANRDDGRACTRVNLVQPTSRSIEIKEQQFLILQSGKRIRFENREYPL